jgi:hypothetical protein
VLKIEFMISTDTFERAGPGLSRMVGREFLILGSGKSSKYPIQKILREVPKERDAVRRKRMSRRLKSHFLGI